MVATLTILGAMMAAGSGTSYFTVQKSIEMILPKVINLAPNGMVYPMFIAPPFKLRSRYFVFELLNRNDFLKGGKPRLGLRGPYFFE